jgi:diaminohydroxyphosphoribosylaminopyrimidine deaminase/5-amino-6-(5-phosphoribosylamino)uracil reductase
MQEWASVEHYYQAQKFAGNPAAAAGDLVCAIAAAPSPEEAARIGRRAERQHPELLTPGWGEAKQGVMLSALRAKFRAHAGPRDMLLSTAGGVGGDLPAELVEASPHDHYWGQGYTGAGRNTLGQLLMQVRQELVEEAAAGSSSSSRSLEGSSQAQRQIQQQEQQQQQGVLLGNGHAQHMLSGRQQQQQQQDAAGISSPVGSM